jgi:hypothetical protein
MLVVTVLSARVAPHAMISPVDNIHPPVSLQDLKKETDDDPKLYDATVNSQVDIIDVFNKLFKDKPPRQGSSEPFKSHVALIPAVGYTTATSLTFAVYANDAFYTSTDANVSAISASIAWSANNQVLLPLKTSIWFPGNKWYVNTDWRYLSWPSYNYGLGGYTRPTDRYLIDYNAIRLHQTLYKRLVHDVYIGLGYSYEYYWNIKETDPPPGRVTDFQKYGLNGTEVESAPTLNFLYDSRRNAINPLGGGYAHVEYIPNLTVFGNKTDWQSMVIDLRKYFRLPANSNNVLAFWNYDWLTLSGTPPYLMLPTTGGDVLNNTGRGYIQYRYRGRNMLYLEGEYRFQLTHSGLFGGVVFANAQSFTEVTSGKFETVEPAAGAGLRLKLNKFSRTNAGLDVGFGNHGSTTVNVTVGEVF